MYNERCPHKTFQQNYTEEWAHLILVLVFILIYYEFANPIWNHFVIYKVSVGQAVFWTTWMLKCVRWQ